MEKVQGLVIVHTGDGKGKTTAAIGLAVRAFGTGLKILVLQFIKGIKKSGEIFTIEELKKISSLGKIEIRQCGLGFTNQGDMEEHKKSAESAINSAREEILSGEWDLIILDEINYAVKFGLIEVEKVLDLIKIRPPELHLVLTGRNAHEKIIDAADLVTEMKLIKHPFQKGITAQSGIEF